MNMKLNKFFPILIIIFFLFFISVFFVSAEERGLEIQYPIIDGQGITTSTTIAEYAVYIFKFSIILAAIIAFAVLIYGGSRYITSSGNPTAMDDAKKWILSAIIGLALVLFSYIILNIINANFIEPDVKEIEPVGGILLIDENGISKLLTGGINEISEDFKATKIEFITDKPLEEFYYNPNKPELISIFYYEEINQGGKVAVVANNKEPDSPSPSSSQPLDFAPRSIYFLWQEPGAYFYENENYESPPRPKVYTESQRTLKNFSDKTKSIKFVEEKPDPWRKQYWTILFKDTDYEGACGAYDSDNPITEIKGSLKENISSFSIIQGTLPQGDVIFYDKVNCQGNEYLWQPKSVLFRYDSVSLKDDTKDLDQWLSLKIDGNFSVLLITEYNYGSISYLGERCLVFSGIGCTTSFKGTSIYSADPESFRPKEAYIFPTME